MQAANSPREHAATALPSIVNREEWKRARDELLVVEKAHTRAGDAVAAQRRRLPMTVVDASLPLVGASGAVTLLELFEGRRQLQIYHHMLKPDDTAPCSGCSAFLDHVPHLAHLNVFDITFVIEAAAPLDQLHAYLHRMGRSDMPAYSTHAHGATRAALNPSPYGASSFGFSAYVRDGDQVFLTYATYGRGVDGVPLIDLAVYGRQESFEDSPAGWPQHPTYSVCKIHDEYTQAELAGRTAVSSTGAVAAP